MEVGAETDNTLSFSQSQLTGHILLVVCMSVDDSLESLTDTQLPPISINHQQFNMVNMYTHTAFFEFSLISLINSCVCCFFWYGWWSGWYEFIIIDYSSLASNPSRRKILQPLCGSWVRQQEWQKHILFGLLHEYLSSLLAHSPPSPSLTGSLSSQFLHTHTHMYIYISQINVIIS